MGKIELLVKPWYDGLEQGKLLGEFFPNMTLNSSDFIFTSQTKFPVFALCTIILVSNMFFIADIYFPHIISSSQISQDFLNFFMANILSNVKVFVIEWYS